MGMQHGGGLKQQSCSGATNIARCLLIISSVSLGCKRDKTNPSPGGKANPHLTDTCHTHTSLTWGHMTAVAPT